MFTPALDNLDAQTLTPLVRAVLDSTTAEVETWQVSPIIQGSSSPAGVYRVAGTAKEQSKRVAWSLVVKVVEAAATSVHAGNNASDDPTQIFYWKRELLLYQSGLLDQLPDGLAAPCCYRIDELPHEGHIWMEDVREDVGAIWPFDHYGQVARHFGRLAGLYLVERPLPAWSWLLADQLAWRSERFEWPAFWQAYPALRQENALVQRGWSDELAQGFQRMWQDRDQFVQALAHLPHTLQHSDAGRKNLFARRRATGDLETVAVDWGSTGIGVIGEELAVLVTQSVYWFNGVRPEQVWELDQIVFDGYLQGLRDAGWREDAAIARLGYTLAVTLRTGMGIFIVEWAARDEALRLWLERIMGHSLEEMADMFRVLRAYLIDCADEARRLLASRAV
jgi:hypothetical protein